MSVFPGLSIGASSMENAANALQIVGNNIANLSTPGFKRSRSMQSTAFSSLLPGGTFADQLGHGALQIHSQRIVNQGANELTGIDTDVAIDGKGWFIVRDPATNETLYTRAGNFRLDENRFLVDPNGKRIQGYAVDPQGVTGTTLSDIFVATLSSTGSPTTLVEFKGNINSSSGVLGAPPTFTSAVKRDEFIVTQGLNDQIVFQMNQGGTSITASLVTDGGLTSGAAVTGTAVANALKQALEAQNGFVDTYTVTYNQNTDRFTILSDGTNQNTIRFLHDNAASTASALMGFAASASEVVDPGKTEASDLDIAFNVLTGVNDTLTVDIDGTPTTITIAAGNYTGQGLAYAMESALRSASSQNVGVQVVYNDPSFPNQFTIKGPLTGGAHTINQPSNTTTPTVAVAAKQVTVTGGTLAATTSLNAGTAANGTGFFDITDPFGTSSASTVTQVVDGVGGQHALTIFMRKVGDNAWEWHGALKGEELTGTTPDGFFEEVASGFIRFDESGRLLTETTTPSTGVFNFDAVGGGTVPPTGQTIAFDFGDSITTDGGTGLGGIVQFESSSSTVSQGGRGFNTLTLTNVTSDGVPAGSFTGFRIGGDGFVRIDFTNGRDQAISRLTLALFPAEDELTAISQNLFRATDVAGTAVLTGPDANGAGKLLAQSLERSNVETSAEFGEMIFQQMAYQANSRVITSANDALETLINII